MKSKSNTYIGELDSLKTSDISLVGLESYNYSKLFTIGNINVPNSMYISSIAFDDFLIATNVTDSILNLLSEVQPYIRDGAWEASGQIVNFIMSTEIPSAIYSSLNEIYSKVSEHGKSLVRLEVSNIIEEKYIPPKIKDLMYENIDNFEDFVNKVRLIWATLFSVDSIELRTNKYYRGAITTAILVRSIKKFELSGKIYSIPPITKDQNTIQINANYGILDGSFDIESFQDEYKVDVDTLKIIEKKIIPQEYMIIRSKQKSNLDSNTITVDISNEWRKKQKLDDDLIVKLSKIGLDVEKSFLNPVEITWGIEMGDLYFYDVEVIYPEEENISIQDEKEFLEKYGIERKEEKNPDDIPDTIKAIDKEIDNLFVDENTPKRLNLNLDQPHEITRSKFDFNKKDPEFRKDIILDISGVNSNNLNALSYFGGVYFDSTELIIKYKSLPEQIFNNEKKITELLKKYSNEIAVISSNIKENNLIYQFSNPGIADFKTIGAEKKYTEFYGDERFIQFPESITSEILALNNAMDSFDLNNISICIPYVRSIENLDDILKIISSVELIRKPKIYVEVALPSIIYDLDEIDDSRISGLVINYDTLLRISVYRATPREADHRAALKIVRQILNQVKTKNLSTHIRMIEKNEYVMKEIQDMEFDGYIFSFDPR